MSNKKTKSPKYKQLINNIAFSLLIVFIFFTVESIVLNKNDFNDKTSSNNIVTTDAAIVINIGEKYSLYSDIPELVWSSSDETIATVDSNGNVLALDKGMVTIMAHDENNLIHEYTFAVEGNTITNLKLITKDITLPIDNTYKLELDSKSKIKYLSNLTWTSSDENIVIVENGIVTAVSEGTAIITVSQFGKVDTCNITVTDDINIEEIEFSENSKNIYAGEEYQSNILFTPSNLYSNITYSSADETIATVTNTGQIKGIKSGNVVITASTGELSTNINITVKKNSDKIVNVSFDKNGATKISATKEKCNSDGNGCQIKLPTITREDYKIIGWSKDANSISAEYQSGDTITVYNDITYYAITSKKLSTKFNANGASIFINNKSCQIYNKDKACKITTPTIVRDGYQIIGWNTKDNATTSEVNQNTNINITSNNEYYAVTSKKLIATFNKNGANTSADVLNCTIYNTDNTCDITTPNITRNGYKVVGWGTSTNDITKDIGVSTKVQLKDNITYYAITYKTLTASFNANGAKISKISASCNIYNTATHCNITTPTISRTNYASLGWGTSASASKPILKANSQVSISAPANYYALTKVNVDGIEKGCTGWMTVNGKYYSNASTSSTSSVLNIGTAFTIEEVIGDYFKVTIPNVSGYKYILHKYVMINLADYIPSMYIDISNANASIFKSSGYSIPNVTGTRLYSTGKVYNVRLRKNEYIVPTLYPVAKKILTAQRTLLSQGYSIKAYDTYRPRSVSTKIYNSLNTLYNSNTTVRNNILYSYGLNGARYTWGKGWFLAAAVSHHNVGAAIDMTLVYSSTGKEVTMPTAMHELSAKAIKYYSPSVSRVPANYAKEMNDVAKIMDSAATNAGLTTLSSEWWHFQDDIAYKAVLAKQSNGCDFQVTNIYSY